MQIAVILAILISMIAAIYNNYTLLIAEILPIAMLSYGLIRMKKKFKKDYMQSAILFGVLFGIALFGPFVLRQAIAADPFGSINYILYVVLAFLALFIILKSFASQNMMAGKVLLADKSWAVVQLDFDLVTGIRAGKYVVKNKGAKKGQKVKVKIKKGIFRKTEPIEVIK
jgi:uncharacterized membrane protein